MSEEDKEPTDPPPEPVRQSSKHVRVGPVEAEDPTVVEWDPGDRFHRYEEEIATGRFKTVYRAYDTENGIDVAWCKVRDPDGSTTPSVLSQIYKDMKKGLALEHPSIVRCFACWLDRQTSCINLITELFTSGTLRSYRQTYSNVSLNVYRKYVRQMLQGLVYLHDLRPPIVHADLRLDKIYVNGFNGEVKIGDLGLAALLTKRYPPSERPPLDSPQEDLFALGICVYELLTGTQLNRSRLSSSFRELLNQPKKIVDPDARDFISQCLAVDNHLTARALLEHEFLKCQTTEFKVKNGGEWDLGRVESQNRSVGTKLRGEDWNFEFQGYESDNDEMSLHVRLIMSNEMETEHVTILDFDYNLETDTPDSVGGDIADSFKLSSTDRELCTAALKEWLAVMSASKGDESPLP